MKMSMKDVEAEILNRFRNDPKEYDTTGLAKAIFTEYEEIDEMLKSSDKQKSNEAKKQKFKLHRKLLYYLNKLVEEHILNVVRTQEKGEKVFALAMDDGNITIEKGYKKITITKSVAASNHIEQYEKQGLMKKFDEQTWINRLNAVMIECSLINPDKAYSITRELFNNVNDVIAFNDFQKHLNTECITFIKRLSQDTLDLDKTISIILNFEDIEKESFKEFIKEYSELNPKRINIVFNTNSRELLKHADIWLHIIKEFSEKKIKINIKNTDLSSSPIMIGRAGIYSFDEEEYSTYTRLVKGRTMGLACSQSSIVVNMNKFFETYKSGAEFRQAILNAAKVLLSANAIQRRKSNEYFRTINNQNTPYAVDFYRFSRNYIRLWNYDWHKDLKDNEEMTDLLNSTKELVENFCISEETIFKSCGIPIRFRIAFSSAFKHFDSKFMGEREYQKTTVKNIEDYYSGDIKEFIIAREKIFEIFDGCDRLRIFRSHESTEQDILREFNLILNTYKIPFFTYDFSQLRGMVKLTNFM
jgi:hypothetical protein